MVDCSTVQDPRWQAVAARDPAFDGVFVYSVASTGVYCRPSCAARLARPENVRFHASCADAEAAGFRPCKRCQPHLPPLAERNAAKIAEICRLIDQAEDMPNLETLAQTAGLSPHHFHRLFKSITGVTPKAYGMARRGQRERDRLSQGDLDVTQALYDAGFNSSSRFYEMSDRLLGMTPSAYRAGGADADIYFAVGQCSLGAILAAQSQRGVCAILLGDDPAPLVRDLQDRFPKAHLIGGDAAFERVMAQVVGLIEDPAQSQARPQVLPLDLRGTAFQQRVWRALQRIPVGSTATYSDIAQRIGAPKAARAVAGACAANALAVAIPCHRVVRTDGSLSGYRWGVERKRALLIREGAR